MTDYKKLVLCVTGDGTSTCSIIARWYFLSVFLFLSFFSLSLSTQSRGDPRQSARRRSSLVGSTEIGLDSLDPPAAREMNLAWRYLAIRNPLAPRSPFGFFHPKPRFPRSDSSGYRVTLAMISDHRAANKWRGSFRFTAIISA
jgi:hypothetical protein